MPKKKKQAADVAKQSDSLAANATIVAAGRAATARWGAIQSRTEAQQIVWLAERAAATALKEAKAEQQRELEEQRCTLQLRLREARPPGAGGADGGGNGGSVMPVQPQQPPQVMSVTLA